MKNPIRTLLGLDSRSGLTPNDIWQRGWDVAGLSSSAAGKRVTNDSALQVSAVWGSVRVIADGISTLPVDSYIRTKGVRKSYPRAPWMSFASGPYTKIDVMNQAMISLLLDGNAYIATYRDAEGMILFLEVLDPAAVTPRQDKTTRQIVWDIQKSDGTQGTLGPMDLLHIRGMAMPGSIEGMSPVKYMRETIGLSLAVTEFGGSFFSNGAMPGVVIESPETISAAGMADMKAGWNEMHRGAGNSHKLAILTEGAKMNKVTVSPDDAQFLQTRGFQINDVARIYGVPTNLLQHSDGPEMGQSLSDKNTAFVQHTLRPWVERLEAGLSWLLWSEGNPRQAFVKFNIDALLRGDHEQRYATYSLAVTQGILTINEVRAFEDLPPVEWGEKPISVQVQEPDTDPDSEPDPEPSNSEEEQSP